MINTIPFIEYVLPHGRARPLEIPASGEVSGMALGIIENGYTFECETLMNGMISFTVAGINADGDSDDLDIELAYNVTDRDSAIERLVRRFYGSIQ
jgi:hypothetical protein